jgi:mRNA-degrading endonuclease HigB of HigAB toxin-antitoxin module
MFHFCLRFLALFFIGFQAQAQFQVGDLSPSTGLWKGQLTYLDYTSGKPFSMAANLHISLSSDQKGYIRKFEYPKEPHANRIDTLMIDKTNFGDAKIVRVDRTSPTDITWVTENLGEDGNDHKKAILRHTYQVKGNQYRITKEVKFEGSNTYIKRHEYLFTR